MHIRKYVKWRQIENGSVLFNTQTGDWLTLNKKRYVHIPAALCQLQSNGKHSGKSSYEIPC